MTNLQTRALSSHTGTEITGLDLRTPLPAPLQAELIRLFAERSVLVFRDQALSPAQMLGAMRQFGEVFPQHNKRFALPECPEIHYVSNEDSYADGRRYIPGEGYHTDHSNAGRPPKATVLHAVALPDHGGDTQFVNMHAAFEALDPTQQQQLRALVAVHVYQSRHSARQLMPLSPEAVAALPPGVRHPLVRRHPVTGRAALYINPIRIEAIEGMEESAALALLDRLLTHATRPEFEYRHRWHPGDLVMWDNRSLLHKANGDYDMSQRRYLYRVMLAGEAPEAVAA